MYSYFDKEDINKFKEINEEKIKNNKLQISYYDRKNYCLVMEFAQNGSLENYYNNYKQRFKNSEVFLPLDLFIFSKLFLIIQIKL